MYLSFPNYSQAPSSLLALSPTDKVRAVEKPVTTVRSRLTTAHHISISLLFPDRSSARDFCVETNGDGANLKIMLCVFLLVSIS